MWSLCKHQQIKTNHRKSCHDKGLTLDVFFVFYTSKNSIIKLVISKEVLPFSQSSTFRAVTHSQITITPSRSVLLSSKLLLLALDFLGLCSDVYFLQAYIPEQQWKWSWAQLPPVPGHFIPSMTESSSSFKLWASAGDWLSDKAGLCGAGGQQPPAHIFSSVPGHTMLTALFLAASHQRFNRKQFTDAAPSLCS